MRNLILLSTLALLTGGVMTAQETNSFHTIDGGQITNVSPNGKYVVGIDPNTSLQFIGGGYRSFLWSSEDNSTNWMTEMSEEHLEKTGYFTDVNDSKVISGYFKNPEYNITVNEWEGSITRPVNVAALWFDGKVESLGIGDFNLSDFNNFNDGSIATSISNDGNTVAGFIVKGNYAFEYPCIWTRSDASAEWDFIRLEMPEGTNGGRATNVSSDGKIITGYLKAPGEKIAAMWTIDGSCTTIELQEEDKVYYNNIVSCVSENGKYAVITLDGKIPALYSFESESYTKTEFYDEAKGVEIYGISNDGNFVGAFRYGNSFEGVYNRPFVYSNTDKKVLDFNYYLSLYAPDVDPGMSFNFEDRISCTMKGISADGKTIVGTNNSNNGWVLYTTSNSVVIPEPTEGVKAQSYNLHEVTVTWTKDEREYEGLTLKSYNIYCDGQIIANVPSTESSYIQNDASAGYMQYAVSSVFENRLGTEIESPKSELITVCIPDTYDLPFFDNFETGSEQTQYWSEYRLVENADFFNFGCPKYTGFLDNCALFTTIGTTKKYSYAIVSRPMDATNEDKVYLSYAFMHYNSTLEEAYKDSLSVEISSDRENWTTIKTYVVDGNRYPWALEKFDITEFAKGQIFQIRFRIHGEGKAEEIYHIDRVKVGAIEEYEAPADLTGIIADKKVNLIWKNSLNAYGLDYLVTPWTRLTVGDEGNTFIAANSFPAEDLEIYRDKYITSVRTFISHNFELGTKDTHASIVIFEDNEIVREQEIKDLEYNEFIVVPLDEPLPINTDKELKVGIKIFDYDPQQIPIVYQNTDEYVKGRSDLYSQDGGKTWLCLSDFFATMEGHEEDGFACWEITANITDEPTAETLEQDENLETYNVYRNGERLNDTFIYNQQTRFTDEAPVDNATYTVIAFYTDGSFSAVSNEFKVGVISVESVYNNENQISVYPNPASDFVCVEGEFSRASLLDISGKLIFTTESDMIDLSGLSSGIYMLKVEKENGNSSIAKIIVNK